MITTKLIKNETERIFDLEAGSLESPSRVTAIVYARHAYWLAVLYFGFEPVHAGLAIDRDRASSYNSITQSIYLCLTDAGYKKRVVELFKTLLPHEKTERTRHGVALYRCAVDAIL